MRISDWSSDVCSSDLNSLALGRYIANERKRDKSCIANQIAVRKGIKAIGRNSYLITSIQPILSCLSAQQQRKISATCATGQKTRSEEHTSELQSLMRNSYAVFCLKKKKQKQHTQHNTRQ